MNFLWIWIIKMQKDEDKCSLKDSVLEFDDWSEEETVRWIEEDEMKHLGFIKEDSVLDLNDDESYVCSETEESSEWS